MAQISVVYWRDIPAQVIAKAGRRTAREILDQRFEKAIDRAAMKAGLRDSDSYLAHWRRGEPQPCDEDLDAAVATLARHLEQQYDESRLAALVSAGGLETADATPHKDALR